MADKKLRITEIKSGLFVIERYYYSDTHWVTLDKFGNPSEVRYFGNGITMRNTEKKYTSLSEAKEAMDGFIFLPKVVLTSENKETPDNDICNPLTVEFLKAHMENSINKEQQKSGAKLISIYRMEACVNRLIDLEAEMNKIADDLNWVPFVISVDRVNDNIDNPI